jgi:DNA end-binding protein Ku
MARAIWKGAISFGLVHIPVALVSATKSNSIDFDWLDKRSMEPVGYKQINKVTGKEIKRENIVKGIQYEKGQYVVLSEEEIRLAHPKTTQTIDIFSFVEQSEIPITHVEVPYYLAPDRRGEKVYALLRKALEATGKVALANVILHTRQHLAVLMPLDAALILILLRWPNEVRDLEMLELGETVADPALNKSELEMAKRLVEDMAGAWEPKQYLDNFQEKIMALVDKKVREGKIETVEAVTDGEERKSADIIDLTELLKKSLGAKAPQKATSRQTTRQTTSAQSTPAKVKSIAKAKPASSAKSKASKAAPAKAAVSKTSGAKNAKSKAPAQTKKSTSSSTKKSAAR